MQSTTTIPLIQKVILFCGQFHYCTHTMRVIWSSSAPRHPQVDSDPDPDRLVGKTGAMAIAILRLICNKPKQPTHWSYSNQLETIRSNLETKYRLSVSSPNSIPSEMDKRGLFFFGIIAIVPLGKAQPYPQYAPWRKLKRTKAGWIKKSEIHYKQKSPPVARLGARLDFPSQRMATTGISFIYARHQ